MKRIFVIAALATLATAANAATKNTAAATTTTNKTATKNTTKVGMFAATNPATPAQTANVAAANGQSATSVATPDEAASKKLSITFLSQIGVGSSEMHYVNRTDKSIDSTNYVAVGYKINKENRIGFRQYFDVSHDGDTKENKTKMSYPVLTYGRSWGAGVAKSEPLSTSFLYYVPTTKATRDAQSNGVFRADTEIVWTINPKIAVSYFLSPRQSVIPTETTIIDDNGKSVPMYSKTSLLHFGTVYYNVNDDVSYYLNVGMNQAWKTSNFDYTSEQFVAYLGGSFNFFGGKLNINPEIDYEVALPRNGDNIATLSRYDEGNLSYALTAVVSF